AQAKGWKGLSYGFAGDEFGSLTAEKGAELPRLGDRVEFIVPHCDPTTNLHDRLYCMRGDKVEAVWPIRARREGTMCRRTILSVLAAAVLAQTAAAAGTRKEKPPEKPRLIEVVFPGAGPLLMFDKDIASGKAAINFRGMKMHYLGVGDRIQEG